LIYSAHLNIPGLVASKEIYDEPDDPYDIDRQLPLLREFSETMGACVLSFRPSIASVFLVPPKGHLE
jgi:hypothetical protein